MSDCENQVIESIVNLEENNASPYIGRTVLESVALHPDRLPAASRPPQTPPVPFETHTTSGSGPARINDDQDQEYLYE